MFTLKHISHEGGETLHEATGVSYMRADTIAAQYAIDKTEAKPPLDDTVWVTNPAGSIYSIVGGWVYVMNDHGATVSQYHLGIPTAAGYGEQKAA